MRWTRFPLVVLLALATAAASWGAVVADYGTDYQPGTVNGQTRPAVAPDGWDYMWNATAPIGTAAGYSSLHWWGGQNHYNFDGAGNLPRANPAAYVNLAGGGGHPGRGVTDHPSAVYDRYAIAAYQIQAGEGDYHALTNSSVRVNSGASNGDDVRVYVNDRLVHRILCPGATTLAYDTVLGRLSPGDRVHVAVGPRADDGSDGFGTFDYTIETVPSTADVLWDADGGGGGSGGTGTWDTTAARWYSSAGGGSYVAWNNASNMNAHFDPAAGTVTVGAPVTARSLSFRTDGYLVDGSSTITLTTAGGGGPGPAAINVPDPAATAALSAPLAAPQLSKIGLGTLDLRGTTGVGTHLYAAGGNLLLSGSSVTAVGGTTYVGVSPNRVTGGESGTLTIQDTATLVTDLLYMGENAASQVAGLTAVVNQTGGTVLITGSDGEGNGIRIGHWPNETSTYNLAGGSLTVGPGELAIAIDGTGVFNQTGGILDADRVVVNARNNANGNGTFTVSGGTAYIGSGGIVNEGTGPATVNLGGSGPTLCASAPFTSSLDMNVLGGGKNGPVIDTDGHTIGLSGSLSGAGAALHKIGDGTLTLSGTAITLDELNAAGGNLVLAGSSATTASNLVRVGATNHWVPNGGSGTLTIQDTASLTTGRVFMGENWNPTLPGMTAVINQTGGSLTITGTTGENAAIRIGHWPNETSTYNLSGGSLAITMAGQDLAIGTDGAGIFTQTGGQASAPGVMVNHRNANGSAVFTVQGGVFIVGSRGIQTAGGPATVNVGGSGGTLRASAPFASPLAMTLSGTGANAATFDTNGHTITLSGQLTGAGGLNKTGPGTLAITSTNSNFSGPTTISNGTLSVSNGRLYNAGWANRAITVTGGAVLEVGGWADGDLLGIGSVSFNPANIVVDNGTLRYTASGYSNRRDRGFTIGAGGATLESAGSIPWVLSAERPQFPIVSAAGGTLTLTGASDGQIDKPIPGSGDVVKTGTGTWTLTASNTYTGATQVNAGALMVRNSIASSSQVTVAPNAVLGGDGQVGRLFLNGLVAPGFPVGTLDAGTTDWAGGAGSGYRWEIADFDGVPGTGWDLFDIAGALNLTATATDPITLYLSSTPGASGSLDLWERFEIARASGGITGYDPAGFVLDASGFQHYTGGNYFRLLREGDSLYLVYVPEPSTLALLGLGAVGLARRRRRRDR